MIRVSLIVETPDLDVAEAIVPELRAMADTLHGLRAYGHEVEVVLGVTDDGVEVDL